jgi:STE24 endopeptidase
MIGFSEEELRRSRRFHRPRYVALAIDLVVAVVVLSALTQLRISLPWFLAALVFPVVVQTIVALAGLPIDWWRYRHDRAYGLATQTPRGFVVDQAKTATIGAALADAAFVPLFVLARFLPHGWVWVAAPGAGLLVFVLGFLAPVVLEPVFNRFAPLDDEALAGRLHELAERAGAPVRAILVADASRRTVRQNAYVSGLGRTRRIVLFDTLLASPADEVAVVLAHELGHRIRRHVAALTAVAVAGALGFLVVLRLLRPHPVPSDTAFVLLLGLGFELVTGPAVAALSRRFERGADRFSIALTGDRPAFERLHRRLAIVNLADLAPPKWLYYWFSTHPTPSQRLLDT